MDNTTLSYLAGAMDSDGYFTIKKSTYRQRVVGDSKNPTYSESVGLGQVTPQVPCLLRENFGGGIYISKGCSENSKPIYSYRATDLNAFRLCISLLPYLLIKSKQAEALIELRETKKSIYQQHSYWFRLHNPKWEEMEMITSNEVTKILGFSNNHSVVSRAIANGTILALPTGHSGRIAKARFPRLLIERLAENASNGKYLKPAELMEWRERLYQQVREFNKIGINGTSVYYRVGAHKPK